MRIVNDPEASDNDRFLTLSRRGGALHGFGIILRFSGYRYVAEELLKNAEVAAQGVLPSCQDTGTVCVVAHRG